jgi:hypothetical protein
MIRNSYLFVPPFGEKPIIAGLNDDLYGMLTDATPTPSGLLFPVCSRMLQSTYSGD